MQKSQFDAEKCQKGHCRNNVIQLVWPILVNEQSTAPVFACVDISGISPGNNKKLQ